MNAFLVRFFIGINTGTVFAGLFAFFLHYFYDGKYEDNFTKVSFVKTIPLKEVHLFFLSNSKQQCIFNVVDMKNKKYSIDFSEDIEYFVKRNSKTFLVKTLDGDFFEIINDDANSINSYKEQLVYEYLAHCQKPKETK